MTTYPESKAPSSPPGALRRRARVLAAGALLALATTSAAAPLAQDDAPDLVMLSLEELLQIEVTLASRHRQSRFTAAASVYVLTGEEIYQHGFTSIPEALRLVPGLQVARLDAHRWAISARGFNDDFSNKLLVLIDGRSVYNAFFSGVHWSIQDLPLEDIDRIEVISGPGGALWGTNAVNGIINIITKSAAETQGTLVSATAGVDELDSAALRHGGATASGFSYRLYAKGLGHDAFTESPAPPDGTEGLRGGFRLDWEAGARDRFTLQGDAYRLDADTAAALPIPEPPFAEIGATTVDQDGGNLLARWNRSLSEGGELQLQAYVDRAHLHFFTEEKNRTFDLDLHHTTPAGRRHRLSWGLGYRVIESIFEGNEFVRTVPEERTLEIASAFVQDDVSFFADHFRLTLGLKLEHNDYTGLETQPSVRAAWTPNERHTLWAAVSRAVRVPSRSERDFSTVSAVELPGVGVFIGALVPSDSLEPEELLAYELGYRVRPVPSFYLASTLFYHDYDALTAVAPSGILPPPPPPLPQVPVFAVEYVNGASGRSRGLELTASWEPAAGHRFDGSYVWLETEAEVDQPDLLLAFASAGVAPEHQVTLRSYHDLGERFSVSTLLSWVDRLEDAVEIPSYTRVDLSLAWRPTPELELRLTGHNLTESEHLEFFAQSVEASTPEIPRSFVAGLTWRF